MSDQELGRLFLALAALACAAHGGGYAFERLRMPRVVGEIAGGCVLGPSVLGLLWPDLHHWLFDGFPAQRKILAGFYWIGLVLLMFTSGFHIQRTLSSDDRRTVAVVLAFATAVPLGLGWLATDWLGLGAHMGKQANDTSFRLIVAVALAVTSIPVISKIFADLGLLETPFARVVLMTATIEDILLWVLVAIATGMATNQLLDPSSLAGSVIAPIAFIGLALLFGPRLLKIANGLRINLVLKASRIGYLLAIALLFAGVASALDVNVAFGGLVAGVVVGTLPEDLFGEVREKITEVSRGFFIPVYFALVGLAIDLPRYFDFRLAITFLLASSVIKMACVTAGGRIAGKDWLSSVNLAFALNTRGGPGIVLASVAYGLGLIDGPFFVALVLAALLTSLASGAWFQHLLAAGKPIYR